MDERKRNKMEESLKRKIDMIIATTDIFFYNFETKNTNKLLLNEKKNERLIFKHVLL